MKLHQLCKMSGFVAVFKVFKNLTQQTESWVS